MPVISINHTAPRDPRQVNPSTERPMRLTARELGANERLAEHSHDWGQLTIISYGSMRVVAAGSTWLVPPTRAIWIPPRVAHEVQTLEPAGLRAVHVAETIVPAHYDTCVVLEVTNFMHELVNALAGSDEGSSREMHVSALILDEMQHTARLPLRVALPKDKRLRQLCEMLIADPGSNLTLAEWAQTTAASERTLVRKFEQELGMSFGQWRQEMRLAHAVPLITKGWPLSRVAAELGYSSQSAFSAMFKKAMGQAPSAFFKQN